MNVADTVGLIEATGATFRLDGVKVLVRYPDEEQREELTEQIALLRARKDEVAEYLRTRHLIPLMPPGLRLVRWNLKRPPAAIETCGVVNEPAGFAHSTLRQLGVALANPRAWVGWTVTQLIDRLGQVGVTVECEPRVIDEIMARQKH